MQEMRNKILHTGHYGWNVANNEFLSILEKAIKTTRDFFSFLREKKLSGADEFLANEEPVDLTKLGFGYV